MAKIKGKTKTGFNFIIDEDIRDDMELLDNLIEMSKGNNAVVPDILISLLGEEQKKKLYDHCRNEKTGRVSSKKVFAEIESIFDKAKTNTEDTKN